MKDACDRLGIQWGILKCCHYYFERAVSSGQRWHIEASGRSMVRALESYMDEISSILQNPAPAAPPPTASDELKLAFKRLGTIKGGEFVKEDK